MVSKSQQVAEEPIVAALLRWYGAHERPLPWRATSPWGVLVSEFMLQQTPVERVLPVWAKWLDRWPTPPDLAAAGLADALRAWGRLGYPRRAQRLHATAVMITRDFDGRVPSDPESLLSLPGVGDYTAAAVQAFAFGRRSIVLDTNVRRVLSRSFDGIAVQPAHVTAAERTRADDLWPRAHARSARWSAAVMEFGALVCAARRPACHQCPIATGCAWLNAGRPESDRRGRRAPEYLGSDRQARGMILALLREQPAPVDASAIERTWPEAEQRERALRSLIADGLVTDLGRDRYSLP